LHTVPNPPGTLPAGEREGLRFIASELEPNRRLELARYGETLVCDRSESAERREAERIQSHIGTAAITRGEDVARLKHFYESLGYDGAVLYQLNGGCQTKRAL
jgi:hypothetical protein